MAEIANPRPQEILEQLEKLLASRYFSNAGIQAAILRRIVESALSGETIKQDDLLAATETHSLPDSNKGRQNALLIRRKVLEYYKAEGCDDLVIIDLLPGRSYKAKFSYHSNSVAVHALERGLQFKRQMTDFTLWSAQREFEKAIEAKAGFAPAWIELAETTLLRALRTQCLGRGGAYSVDVARTQIYADEALLADPQCFRAYLVAGASFMMCGDHGSAAVAFNKVFELHPEEASVSLWYAAFLATSGNVEAAVEIARRRAEQSPDSAGDALAYAVFLYLNRKPETARQVVYNGIPTAGINVLQDLAYGLIELDLGEYESAFHSFKKASQASYAEFLKEKEILNTLYSTGMMERVPVIKTETLRGLLVAALYGAGRFSEAEKCMQAMLDEFSLSEFQAAVAYMAIGLPGKALDCLFKCNENDIFINWVDVLPLFFPLRSEPRFRQFVERTLTPRHSSQDWFSVR
jgi:tetratricopeptide (TPR) repeat protein